MARKSKPRTVIQTDRKPVGAVVTVPVGATAAYVKVTSDIAPNLNGWAIEWKDVDNSALDAKLAARDEMPGFPRNDRKVSDYGTMGGTTARPYSGTYAKPLVSHKEDGPEIGHSIPCAWRSVRVGFTPCDDGECVHSGGRIYVRTRATVAPVTRLSPGFTPQDAKDADGQTKIRQAKSRKSAAPSETFHRFS